MASSQTLKMELESAKQIRCELLTKMDGDNYDPTQLEQLQMQQQRIATLVGQIATVEAAEAAATKAAPTAQSGGTAEVATVSLLSGGKSEKTFQVPAGCTLGDLLNEVGWDVANYTIKKRLGFGQSAVLTDGMDYVLTAGLHEISLLPAVEGGG